MVAVRALCVLAALSLSTLAVAQERPTLNNLDQRLDRVENVLDQSLLQLLQRIDDLQQEVRVLSGGLETLQNELNKQQQRSRELYRDTDRRVDELESAPKYLPPDALDGLPFDETLDLDEPQPLTDEVGSNEATPRFVNPNQSQLVASNANDPLAPQIPVRANTTRAATQNEKAAYANAYDLLARGNNSAAITAFDGFLREFPDGPFSDNAWYWQGEAHYATRDFDAAQNNFSIVVNSFPESAKVPDARLKIGYALYEEADFQRAREVLTSVQNDYPGRSASVLARKRLQKMNRDGD